MGVYRLRHPERTVFYRVLFHYFDRFLTEYESRFEKQYGFFRPIIKEVVERYLDCGHSDVRNQDQSPPPPPQIAYQEVLMAAETAAEYIS